MDWSSLIANQWTSVIYENLNNTFTSPSTSAFDADQFNTIQLLSKFSAAASFFGSLTIVLTFIIFPRLRSTNNRLILFLSINDTMGSVAFFIGRWTIESRNIGFCFWQAYILQQCVLGAGLWTGALAANLLCVIKLGKTEQQIARYERYYHILCWGLPLLFSVIMLIVGASDPTGPVFGNATLWCWIRAPWSIFQIVLFYIPMWTIFFFNAIVYIIVGRQIVRALAKTAWVRSKEAEKKTQRRKRRYIRAVTLYLAAFFFTWLWSWINRIQNWANPGNPIYILFAMQAFFNPTNGFFNFLVYFWTTMFPVLRKGKLTRKTETSTGNNRLNTSNELPNTDSLKL